MTFRIRCNACGHDIDPHDRQCPGRPMPRIRAYLKETLKTWEAARDHLLAEEGLALLPLCSSYVEILAVASKDLVIAIASVIALEAVQSTLQDILYEGTEVSIMPKEGVS